ncbi:MULTISPECIES: SMEK domain-containing protein [Pseudomonas]|uniref:SMEK domain-containing protein n=1 Tax=Pseudomonas TaxID=286 RepID=UPI002249A249|nr:SMEK domain-containing protein [Pseudomonas sp. DCB_BG]MCX2707476.1 SMEK domain-containing protein [Pseudomonas sp. DCB_BG]
MIDALIRNLQADIALLQTYIIQRQKAGFHDMERMLEALSIHMFRALSIGDLSNKNQLNVNFPAIDLADDKKKIAVQVTSNASPAKIEKTIKAFESKNEAGVSLKDSYATLYIFGFCKASKSPTPAYCKVIDPSYFIGELCDKADEDKIQSMLNAVRRHHDYSSLHPWNDKDSLEIILNTINRNAIKHMMSCEGNISDMTQGLKEISELISKGTIRGKDRAKSISDFDDQTMIKFLREIMDSVSDIQAIVNGSKSSNDDFVAIDQQGMMKIDELKTQISKKTSEIAKAKQIDIAINLKSF